MMPSATARDAMQVLDELALGVRLKVARVEAELDGEAVDRLLAVVASRCCFRTSNTTRRLPTPVSGSVLASRSLSASRSRCSVTSDPTKAVA